MMSVRGASSFSSSRSTMPPGGVQEVEVPTEPLSSERLPPAVMPSTVPPTSVFASVKQSGP